MCNGRRSSDTTVEGTKISSDCESVERATTIAFVEQAIAAATAAAIGATDASARAAGKRKDKSTSGDGVEERSMKNDHDEKYSGSKPESSGMDLTEAQTEDARVIAEQLESEVSHRMCRMSPQS